MNIEHTPMKTKFKEEEILKALKSLRNNKAAGVDELRAEQLKYGPINTIKEIANIFNQMAETGERPKELYQGLLVAHQKPGKKQGPIGNLRPIILMSILRKILAICMIGRVGEKIIRKIPKTQAAYQPGRSTTEQVFVFKTMAEKAISSKDYEAHVLMMDMSRAFDTVNREKLLEILEEILEKDELHIMKLLINDVQFIVRCGEHKGTPFTTNIGTPQGDCLSPILFILYLAKALNIKNYNDINQIIASEHNYHKNIIPKSSTINEQYADDLGWVTNGPIEVIEDIKNLYPPRLAEYKLKINPEKNEEFSIKYNGDNKWKTIKVLGSRLDTKEDIKLRKILALDAVDKLGSIWESRTLTINLKFRFFNVYIESIFLYNSELWTVNKTINKQIDSFQRRLLRYMLNIKYPRIITNENLKQKVKFDPWSKKIKIRRLKWTGHLFRLNSETAAKQVLNVADLPSKHRKGRRINTWRSIVTKELEELGISWEEAKRIAQNRETWKNNIISKVL